MKDILSVFGKKPHLLDKFLWEKELGPKMLDHIEDYLLEEFSIKSSDELVTDILHQYKTQRVCFHFSSYRVSIIENEEVILRFAFHHTYYQLIQFLEDLGYDIEDVGFEKKRDKSFYIYVERSYVDYIRRYN